eukprot:15446450-Alexandrium_andersonii.AAC.1
MTTAEIEGVRHREIAKSRCLTVQSAILQSAIHAILGYWRVGAPSSYSRVGRSSEHATSLEAFGA